MPIVIKTCTSLSDAAVGSTTTYIICDAHKKYAMRIARWISTFVAVGGLALTAGCASSQTSTETHRQLVPADFAAGVSVSVSSPVPTSATPRTTVSADQAQGAPASGGQPEAEPPSDTGASTPPKPQVDLAVSGDMPLYTVDAMVGQVNGKPIYASTVFESIFEQLAALGRSLPRGEFRQRAGQLIEARLGQMVTDALILGEAESGLTAQEYAGLQNIIKQQREELIRFWGKGSVALAQVNLVRQTSRDLDQTLAETRQRFLVQRYLREELFPKINVVRKDVERYYNDHINEYNPPTSRTLRLIRVGDVADADQIDRALGQGQSFEQVASLPINTYRLTDAGRMSEKAQGDQVFGQPPLNEAMLRTGVGEHSPRIRVEETYWWIGVEAIDTTPGRSLTEVQLEIESQLRRQRFQELTRQYRQELFKTGSYNPLGEMSQALLEVAMSRFAVAQ